MKRIASLLIGLLLLFALALPTVADGAEIPPVTTSAQLQYIQKYGNVILDLPAADFDAMGYRFGDVLTLSVGGQSVTLPYCDSYGCVDAGQPVLAARSGYLLAAVNMGDFAGTYGVADKTRTEDGGILWSRSDGAERVELTISLAEQGGYFEEYALRSLQYTDTREDYPDLTDAQFANFRAVSTTGMGLNRLYRSSTPIDPRHGRNEYADAAMADAGVTLILNLADSAAEAAQLDGFPGKSYAAATVIYAPLGLESNDADTRRALAEGLRAFAAKPGVYAIHCIEGAERAGFVAALLECLMGAEAEEVAADYMESYANYYGVTPSDARYETILRNGLLRTLSAAFGVENVMDADLAESAARYLAGAGMTEDEIARLKANLAAGRPFCDVSDDDADAAEAVKAAGWMGGTDAQHFTPAAALSRAQLAVILWRAAGQPAANAALPFADVAPENWYAEAVRWAASEGISNGVAPGVFAPDAPVTREQLAAMLYRFEKVHGNGFTGLWSFRLPFSDADEVSEWAREPLSWLTMQGVFDSSEGALLPHSPVSRGEAAGLLARWKVAA